MKFKKSFKNIMGRRSSNKKAENKKALKIRQYLNRAKKHKKK